MDCPREKGNEGIWEARTWSHLEISFNLSPWGVLECKLHHRVPPILEPGANILYPPSVNHWLQASLRRGWGGDGVTSIARWLWFSWRQFFGVGDNLWVISSQPSEESPAQQREFERDTKGMYYSMELGWSTVPVCMGLSWFFFFSFFFFFNVVDIQYYVSFQV